MPDDSEKLNLFREMIKHPWLDKVPKEELEKYEALKPFGEGIVIDNGTALTKIGFAGEDQPRSIFPTLIGYTKFVYEYYLGEEAMNLRNVLKLTYPIEYGLINDWDVMEKLWQYTFDTLQVNPLKHPVLLIVSPFCSNQDIEKIAKIFFGHFSVPSLRIEKSGVLPIIASGRTTGLCVDMGEKQTRIIPFYECLPIEHAIKQINIAGRDVTKYLHRLLRQKGYALTYSTEREIVRDIKERLCYVPLDLERELNLTEKVSGMEKQYTLPDGEILKIGTERFLAPEVIFNPAAIGQKEPSLAKIIHETIQKCDTDLHKELYQNIVLSGGSSMFPGLKERLHKELSKIGSDKSEIRIIAPPKRCYSVWLGGSISASLKTLSSYWTSRLRYIVEGTNTLLY